MRIVFMGTPPFAATILSSLLNSRHNVAGVVTRPDSPRGRGRVECASAVGELAQSHGVPLVKPSSSKDPYLVEALRQWEPDTVIVAAFGFILSKSVLEIPPRGCINVHASLLPAYRGAAPIQQAIIDGQTQTGITTMLLDDGLDTGDILLRERVPIPPDITAGELEEQLARTGCEVLLRTLDEMERGTIRPVPQDDSLATYARSLRPEAGNIHFDQTARDTHNRIRGCTPRPGARCFLDGKAVRVWRSLLPAQAEGAASAAPGTVTGVSRDTITVACADCKPIILCEVQPAGRGRMSAGDFARGARLAVGNRFDGPAAVK